MTPVPTQTLPVYFRHHGFDPAPDLAALRDTGEITLVKTPFGGTAHLVTRHEDIRRVLADTTCFSSVVPAAGQNERQRAGNLLMMDPPGHTKLRRLLTPAFTVRRMRQLQPRIVEIVEDHLDAMATAGSPADLVTAFALPIPSLVICELLGVPYADRAEFTERSNRQIDTSLTPAERQALAAESRAYMSRLVANAQTAPGDDLLGILVRDHGEAVSTDELIGVAALLLLAGHETTANMLSLGTLALLRHPDQFAAVRDDPASVASAVEELLRWLSVVQALAPRITTTAVTFGGREIPTGELVLCVPPVANRDPSVHEDPDRLDVHRGAPGHLAFGHGVHHCLGAPLARMEMTIAFPALLRRFPGLALAVSDDDLRFRSAHMVYGLHALPVTW